MPWPLSQDYNEAIQDPKSAFGDAELQGGQLKLNSLGLPLPCSGNFADVYEVTCPASKSKYAVKCFTRQVPGLRERYTAISKHLKEANLPFTVDFEFLERGIRIRGDWFPVLKMRWVEGLLLNEFIRANLDKPPLLQALGQIWLRMARRLREANIAHADLQHGNVLLVPGSKQTALAVKLIDYDGMWVPALAQKTSGEVGHPNYQHPQRSRDGIYSAEVDRFPLLVVATALRAVTVGGKALWQRYDNGDNLLFKESDIKAPDDSPVFRELAGATDPLLQKLVGRLRQACRDRLDQTPLLAELIPEEKTTAVQARPAVPAAASSPPPPSAWDFQQGSPGAVVRPGGRKVGARRQRTGLPAWAWWVGGSGLAALAAMTTVLVFLWRSSPADTHSGPVVQNTLPIIPPPLSLPATHPTPPPTTEAPATRPVPPETRVIPPDTQPPPPPTTRSAPPETRVTPPQTQVVPPTTEKVEPPPRPAVASLFRMLGKSTNLVARSGEKEATWQIYDAAMQEVVQRFDDDHPAGVVAFCATPDGDRAAVLDDNGTATVWNTRNGKRVVTMSNVKPRPALVALSADGMRLALSTGRSHLVVWDFKERKQVGEHRLEGNDTAIALSPDGQMLASAAVGKDDRYPIRLLDAVTGKVEREWSGHTKLITALAFAPDGKRLLSAGQDEMLRLWKTDQNEEEASMNGGPAVNHFVFSADGSRVIAAAAGQATVWDLTSKKRLLLAGNRPPARQAYAFNAGADQLMVVEDQPGYPLRQLKFTLEPPATPPPVVAGKPFFEVFSGTRDLAATSGPAPLGWTMTDLTNVRSQEFLGHKEAILCFSASPDGKFAITGSADRTARVWDTDTGKEIAALKEHAGPVAVAAVSPDGKLAVTPDGESDLVLWDVAKQAIIRRVPGFPKITALAFLDTRQVVACGTIVGPMPRGVLWVADLEKPEIHHHVPSLPGPVVSVAAAPNGKKVATISGDGTLSLIDLVGKAPKPTTAMIDLAGTPREVRFSPDGDKLLLQGERRGIVRGVASGRTLLSYNSGKLRASAFADGGSKLLEVDNDGGALTPRRFPIPADAPVAVRPPPRRPRETRKPVPSKEELTTAEKEVREQFKDLYKTKSSKLGVELTNYALGGGAQDSANRYAALKEVRNIRVQEGDISNALFFANEMARRYEVDPLQTRTETVEALAPYVKAPQVQFQWSELLGLIYEARGEERGDLIARLVKAVTAIAAKGTLAHRSQMAIVAGEVKDEQATIKRVHEALTKLETDPDNADAHLTVAQIRERQERWGEAVRHLARTADAGLKSLAEKEMADPADAAGRKALAAAWDAQATRETARTLQFACCCRSLFWYRRALLVATPAETGAIQNALRAMEKRVPDYADPWRDLDVSDLPEIDRKKDVLHFDRRKHIWTRQWYKGGVDVTVVARTGKTNIRLAAGRGGEVIFNWEGGDGGLLIHRPDSSLDDGHKRRAPGSILPGKPDVLLKPNQWYTLRWQLTPEGQKVWVDNELVYEVAESYDLSTARPVAVFSIDSPIEVKSVAVRDLGGADTPMK
jgi:WD40 repeat protein